MNKFSCQVSWTQKFVQLRITRKESEPFRRIMSIALSNCDPTPLCIPPMEAKPEIRKKCFTNTKVVGVNFWRGLMTVILCRPSSH